MMRIAFDHQTFSMQAVGGVSRYFARLARSLADGGEDVRVFAGIYQNEYLRELPSRLVDGAPCGRYPPKTSRIMLVVNRWRERGALRRWRPDLLHETYYAGTSLARGKVARVVTVFDMIHELFGDRIPATDRTAAAKRIAVQRADHVICISENTRRDLLRLVDIAPERVSAVHLGVDALPTGTPVVTSRPYLLYVGKRDLYKNFDRMLRAIAHSKVLADCDVKCFGGGRFTATERAQLTQLGLSEARVQHVAGDDAALAACYDGALALVYPSLYEGFGLPPLEAMTRRCAVACSDVAPIREVTGDAAQYFDPTDEDAIAASLEQLVQSASLRADLISRGTEQVRRYSWERCARETRAIYAQVRAASA